MSKEIVYKEYKIDCTAFVRDVLKYPVTIDDGDIQFNLCLYVNIRKERDHKVNVYTDIEVYARFNNIRFADVCPLFSGDTRFSCTTFRNSVYAYENGIATKVSTRIMRLTDVQPSSMQEEMEEITPTTIKLRDDFETFVSKNIPKLVNYVLERWNS